MSRSAGSRGRPDDARIIEGFLQGDAAAVEAVDALIRRAAASFRHRLGPDREDILQDARIEALQSFRQRAYRGDSSLGTYLGQLTSHTCIDALRRQRRRHTIAIESLDRDPVTRDPSPFDEVVEQERRQAGLAAVQALPARCRERWRLILSGASYREISAQLGVSVGALRVQAFRCRKAAIQAWRRQVGATGSPTRPIR